MTTVPNDSVLSPDLHETPPLSVTSQGLISNEVRQIFQWVFFTIICELIDVFGVAANIINITCFFRMGFKDTINISLLGLAISDVGCLATLLWTNVCYNPAFNELDLPFEPIEFQYITGGGPHIIFSRITSCITAFITLERCLCITLPLKVKALFTSKRVTFIILSIFVAVFANMLPVYYVTRLGSKFSTFRNKTIIGIVFTDDHETAQTIIYAISGVLLELGSFVIVSVCTVTLVVKLQDKTKWRQMSTASGQTENASTRDQKVTRMVMVISSLFIVCFSSTCMTLLAMMLEPELSVEGRHRNLFICVFSICFVLESANSAMNIFIYYYMSSKFRSVFKQLFSRRVKYDSKGA